MSRIVCIGICTVDAIARTVDEYPSPGGLRLFDDLTITTGGNAVNCSIALAKMGIACDLIVKVGDDVLGQFVLAEALRHNIDTSGVIRDAAGTTTPFTFACVRADGQRSFFHTMGTNATLRLEEIDMRIVGRAKFCFVTGTMIMTALDGPPTAELLRRGRDAGAVTLLDTVYVDAARHWREAVEPCLPHLDYFIPSEPEAAAITGQVDPARVAEALQAKGCRNVVIKMGAAGAFWRDAGGKNGRCPAFAVPKVVDTTGAGDCWSAGFLAGLLRGEPLPQAVDLGNATAAFGIQAPGASTGVRPLPEILQFRSTAGRLPAT
jgi:sugar/nucleoside kinase (ribokinase family)